MAEKIFLTFTDSNNTTRLQQHDRKKKIREYTTGHLTHTSSDSQVIALYNSPDNQVEFYAHDGTLEKTISDSRFDDANGIFSGGSDVVYVTTDSKDVLKVNKNGVQWEQGFGGNSGKTEFASYDIEEGKVFVGKNDGNVQFLDDSNGNQLTELNVEAVQGSAADATLNNSSLSEIWFVGQKINDPSKTQVALIDASQENVKTLYTLSETNQNRSLWLSNSEVNFVFFTEKHLYKYTIQFELLGKVTSPIDNATSEYNTDFDGNDNIYLLYQRSDGTHEVRVYDKDLFLQYISLFQADINSTTKMTVEGTGSYDTIPEADKEVFIQFFDVDGNFVYQDNTKDLGLSNIPEYTEEINGGANSIELVFAENYPNVQDITQNNNLYQADIRVIDRETPPEGALWYRGFQIDLNYEADENGFSVPTFTYGGYTFDMQNIVLEDGSGNTRFTKSNMEIGEIMKDLIDLYRNEGGRANYSNASIDDTGVTTDFTVREESLLEALGRLIDFAPRFWYWFVTVDGIVKLKRTNVSDPAHEFMYGRDLQTYTYNRSNAEIVNRVYFRGGDTGSGRLYKRYDQTASQSTFGKRATFFSDGRITKEGSADLVVKNIFKNRSSIVRTISGSLIDSNNKSNGIYGHDLEAIEPGQGIVVNDPNVKTRKTLWKSTLFGANQLEGTGEAKVTQSGSDFTLTGTSGTKFTQELKTNRGVNMDNFFGPPVASITHTESSDDRPSPDVEVDDDRDFYNIYNESGDQRLENSNKYDQFQWDFKPSEDIYTVEVDEYDVDDAIYLGSATKVTKLDKAGNKIWEITGLTGPVRAMAANNQRDVVWIADDGDKVKKVNKITGEVLGTYTTSDNSNVISLAVGRNTTVLIGKANGKLERILPQILKDYEISPHTDSINAIWADRDKDKIYTASSDNTIKQLEPDGTVNWTNSDHTNTVTDVDGHPDNEFVYSVGKDAKIREIKNDGTQNNSGDLPSFTTGSIRGYAIAVDEFTTSTAYEDKNNEIDKTDERYFWNTKARYSIQSVNSDTDADVTPINGWDTDKIVKLETLNWFYLVRTGNGIWNQSTWNFDIEAGLGVGIQLQSVTKSLYDGSFEASEKSGSISRTIKELRARVDEQDGRDTPDKPS